MSSAPLPGPMAGSWYSFGSFPGRFQTNLSKIASSSEAEAGIIFALAGISVGITLLYLLRNIAGKHLPQWLKPFAKEESPESSKTREWTHWTALLAFIGLTGLVLSVVPIWVSPRRLIAVFDIVPWLSASLITAADRPTKTPRILLVQYLLMLLAGLGTYSVQFLDKALTRPDPFHLARLVLCGAAIVAIGNMPLRDPSWDVQDIANPRLPPSHHVRSPEDNLSLFQFWAMTWVYPLARVCRRREIAVEDVWQLPLEFQHARLYMAFRELKGRLLRCLVAANGLDLSVSVALAVAEKVAEVSNIRLTSSLYAALDAGDPDAAVFWCLVMLCVDGARQVSKTTSSWYARKAYERSRGETFIALFGKLLTRAVPGSDRTEKGPAEDEDGEEIEAEQQQKGWLARASSKVCGRRKRKSPSGPTPSEPASNAKVVNLVRGDTYEISQRFWEFPKLVSQPIKVLFTIYYLVDIMGWPSSVGFGVMAIFFAVNSLLVREIVRLERQRTAHSDKRAQAVSHFVEASRPLKLNGWTWPWAARIMRFRAQEMRKRLQLAYTTAAISTVNIAGGGAYPLASICLYTLILRRGLPNDVIWPSLQLFDQLEVSVKESFDLISAYWKATIPVERVHKYMGEPDRDEDAGGAPGVSDIEFHDASFSWPSTDKLVLRNLDIKFGTGLTVIRGKVGSGKSSLLLAALNEMELHGGSLSRPSEPIGYAQQLPWLQNTTIRENIVFHQPFDPTRYQKVLRACALNPDLAALPDGDQTKLEEGGVGLSGGQKARVALARAVYSRCRILLLDDPLAALDHDTASTIVRRLLQGPLVLDEKRTVVMVTHRDDLVLRIADQVVDVDDGKAVILTPEQIDRELEHPYHVTSTAGAAEDNEPGHEHTDEVATLKEPPEEPAETGGVSLTVYTKYMRAGGWHLWILLAIFYGASRYCAIVRARFLEAWGSASTDISESGGGYWGLPDPERRPKPWLYVLSGLSAGQIVSYAVAQLLLARISVDAAQGLFKTAVEKVGKATFRYHDITPTGQLKNRLIADMGMVDGGILAPLESFIYNLIALVLSLTAIMTHQPSLLIVLTGVSLLFVYFFRVYVPVSRCLRRMEMRYLTPIIANIGVMQDGLVTIRALRAEGRFQTRHLDAVDDFQKQDHFFWGMAFWLDFRLSMSSAVMRAALILLMLYRGTPASAVGFVLTQTTIAMASVQQLCERFAQLQLDAVSLERVDMLNRIPEEPPGDLQPPAGWPRPSDDVRFDALSFRYADDLPPVLDRVSFRVPAGATCAVLGRTGSGKSTVANALLATQAASAGAVRIGGVDLARVDRAALRRGVTYIQQDPTLFPGTLRDNMDPEGAFADAACAAAIARVLGGGWGLGSRVDAAGKNLSQGQRQLVGIGRAVLRRSGLVILDEATASIDRATAAVVQRVLREELAESTVITIAHRLEAVEDASWCLRLDQGRVVECGPAQSPGGGWVVEDEDEQ